MVNKPNGVVYCIAFLLVYPVLRILFRLQVDRSSYHPPKGPFILLANHQSFMDFLLVMLAAYPHRLNAVAAQRYFYYRPLNWLLPFMGAIPKVLFEPDLRAALAMRKVIKQGNRLLLFPEGRDTVHGPYMGMSKDTGKLIKTLKVPVLSCTIEGSYTCMPFWRKTFRRGRIRVTLANLFTEQDTQELVVDEINRRIDARLSGEKVGGPSGAAVQTGHGSHQKPLALFRAKKLAEGLENILYYCPVCQSEFTLETSGNAISCTVCGSGATMNSRAQLISPEGSNLPTTVADWYKAQVLFEKQFLAPGKDLVRDEVIVWMPQDKGRGFTVCGQGELRLTSKGWYYDGELLGERAQRYFALDTVPVVPFDPNSNIQICSQGSFYFFAPKNNPRASAKYATLGECAYWRFASSIKMTPGHSGFSECAE
ncbi:MAG: 1-acyl-sn-glycerol-3-phosphate acyltransferase [Coriobacteriales bacterium]|jgi:1-acyl-sn-glycerol-3-phosphate acyltransferase/DNA-directed RNA polymerase subunit RPC12/RpoP|nr:1-acyl-sn-glycerol-3-phosphate acyltransferase [Coriobacteriales bacterium]